MSSAQKKVPADFDDDVEHFKLNANEIWVKLTILFSSMLFLLT